ncbi:metal-dependent hydrolase [Haloarculaceae archaeon H-GB11]|nr:metal-dependent hydrolase [Haloarculaceae archaeon H-GB11]
MVDIMGHLAFGLLFAIPAWFRWRKRVSASFVSLTAVFALVPDIDIWLATWFPWEVHHHGVTHTIVFVVAASLVVGVVTAAAFTNVLDDWFGRDRFDSRDVFGFVTVATALGGVSHVFADTLSAPDISTPIEPFWPFITEPFPVDVIYYDDPSGTWVFSP